MNKTLLIFLAVFTVSTSASQAETFNAWIAEMFGQDEASLTAPDADPDGDGMSNLLEYALDGDPLFPDAVDVLPVPTIEEGKLVYRFKSDTARADVTLAVRQSTDLKVWNGIVSTIESVRKTVERRVVTLDLGSTRGFLRLEATRN